MKLCHIVSHIDEEASGPSYSVPRLTQSISGQGHDITLATLDRGSGQRSLAGVEHLAFRQSRVLQKLGRSVAMQEWLSKANAHGFDVFHSHGLWMMPNIYPARAAARNRIPHVVAPRGTLDPAALAYSRRVKEVFWRLGQKRALQLASALHATSEEEAIHIRAQGLRQPIILSPNGIDIPKSSRPLGGARRTLLYLGRLHEKKGLDLLLAAWSNLEPAYLDWDLRIIGKGSASFEAGLAEQIKRLRLTRVELEGPAYGEDKLSAFQNADLFVLPTRGENFGMVVAEALATGTPVVTTTGAPWKGLKEYQAGWWTGPNVQAIQASLHDAMSTPRQGLEEMGLRGRAWMKAAFGWDRIGADLVEVYVWLLNGGDCPKAVLDG